MIRKRTEHDTVSRHGIILLVVLAMLTLFAILGITFVIYAESAANEARLAREAEQVTHPDVDPQVAGSLILGQIIYDVLDPDLSSTTNWSNSAWGAYSALRGHSLARNMYGWNPSGTNDKPYCGPGRINEATSVTSGWPSPYANYATSSFLVNFTPFINASTTPANAADPAGFIRDPERLGIRASFSAAKGAYLACNAPYTYPDQQNMFLAAIRSDGTVLVPSYHRPWIFNPTNPAHSLTDMTNVNWSNVAGKHLTLRPREYDQRLSTSASAFPNPDEDLGDVKNLTGFPGGNDSIWIDFDAPVQIAPDGRKFKMLVAPLILDLDNRVNLTTAGNILQTGNGHASNQGIGPWEVNLSKVLSSTLTTTSSRSPEWTQIFLGSLDQNSTIRVPGKYGVDGLPSGTAISTSNWPISPMPTGYGQVDFNGISDPSGPPSYSGSLSTNFLLPGATGTNSYQCFPTYPNACFNNGNQSAGGAGLVETTSHPLTYNTMRANANTGDDRVFSAYHMPAVLLNGGTNTDAYYSDVLRLLPNNLGYGYQSSIPLSQFAARNLVTVTSFDVDRPGVLPYSYIDSSPATDNYTLPSGSLYPSANPLTFPASGTIAGLAGSSEFDAGGRSVLAALGRMDLNRTLASYPFLTDPNFVKTRRFDTTNMTVMNQVTQANADRQQFAQDILNRLLIATGAQYSQDANACQWLAQLAVNIVDYIDTDDISTVFNYAVPGTALTGTVYGTELPRLVINETYVQWDNNPTDVTNGTLANPYNVNVYVELFNPLTSMPANSQTAWTATGGTGDDGLVALQNDYGPVYQLVLNDLANATSITGGSSQLRSFSNTKGDPDTGVNVSGNCAFTTPVMTGAFQPFTAAKGWGASGTVTSGMGPAVDQQVGISGGQFSMPPSPMASGTAGWYVIGPQSSQVYTTAPTPMDPGFVPNSIISCQQINGAMSYTVSNTATNLPAPTILLRRLANPYLPDNESTSGGTTPYNPYITIDYMQTSQSASLYNPTTMASTTVFVTNDDRRLGTGAPPSPPTVASRMSWGRREPYAGLSTTVNTQLQPQIPPGNTNPYGGAVALNTFFGQNSPDGTSSSTSMVSDTFQAPFDWLVHLDRQLISPMELLHVSAFKPHELTQQFVQFNPNAAMGTSNAQSVMPNGHLARWTDPNTRLSRAFEVLATKCRSNGVAFGGRVPGRININTIFDKVTFRAVCDAQPSNMFYSSPFTTSTDDAVDAIFTAFMSSKTPNYSSTSGAAIGSSDRPFIGMAVGASPGTSDELPYNVVATRGVDYTLLAAATPPTVSATYNNIRLMEPNDGAGNPSTPNNGTMNAYTSFVQLPYQRSELLRKVFNNFTTRSNVFGVWLTVGLFEVTNDSVRPVQLGAEIGKSENRQVRHHMFAIVDRTNLQIWPTIDPTTGSATVKATTPITITAPATTAPPATTTSPQPTLSVTLSAISGTHPYTGNSWSIQAGSVLTFDPDTDNEETVVVQSVSGSAVSAIFFKQHPLVTGATVPVISRGNPGPWLRYDPRNDTGVVPYFTVID